MPDWLAPFHLPEFTDSEFAEKKAKYVAKHGYTITVPGLSDIFKFKLETPLTEDEQTRYEKKQWDTFTPWRLEEIREMKARRKRRYLGMLASPTPAIVQNFGSIMVAFDDAQDALSTASITARMAMRFAPRALSKVMAGPIGWTMTASDIINVNSYLRCALFPKDTGKRKAEFLKDANPFSKKARLKRALKINKGFAGKGAVIEAMQVTADVFGIGISLGPIVGLIQDVFFAIDRIKAGKSVSIDWPKIGVIEDLKKAWQATSSFHAWSEFNKRPEKITYLDLWKNSLKALASGLVGHAAPWHTDDEDLLMLYMAGLASHQVIMPHFQEFNPLNELADLGEIEIPAPVPDNPITLEILQENGHKLDDVCGWPWNGKIWTSLQDIVDHAAKPATDNVRAYIERNNHNWFGYSAASIVTDTALYSLANLEGEEFVQYDYTAAAKGTSILAEANYAVAMGQPREKIQLLADWFDQLEATGQNPDLNSILLFCRDNGIEIGQD